MKKKIIIVVGILIMIFSNTAFVYAATYEIFTGGFASAKNLTWNTSNGASSSEATTAIAQWSGIVDTVSFVKSSEVLNHQLTVSPGLLEPPTAGEYGLTSLYRNNTLLSTTNFTWDKAICVRYNNDDFATFAQKTATTAHEIGHALSLAHCANPEACSVTHLMHQGLKSSYVPTSYDIAKLKYKW